MDLLAALGEARVQVRPLDPDELSVPERDLLSEWLNDYFRRKNEARKKAQQEAESRKKRGSK